MKGLAIYSICALGFLLLGLLVNIVEKSSTGYTYLCIAVLIPILVLACKVAGKN